MRPPGERDKVGLQDYLQAQMCERATMISQTTAKVRRPNDSAAGRTLISMS